jgi:hypothetical protein
MRFLSPLVLGLCAIALGSCSVGGDEGPDAPASPAPPGATRANEPREEARSIRGWSAALNRGDFAGAASFFARNAVVEQQQAVRLPDRAAAIAFNRSLPCRADVTDVKRRGSGVVAAFRLRAGRSPGGGCSGAARVRFRFKGGKFTEWRQLPEPDAPDGVIA